MVHGPIACLAKTSVCDGRRVPGSNACVRAALVVAGKRGRFRLLDLYSHSVFLVSGRLTRILSSRYGVGRARSPILQGGTERKVCPVASEGNAETLQKSLLVYFLLIFRC